MISGFPLIPVIFSTPGIEFLGQNKSEMVHFQKFGHTLFCQFKAFLSLKNGHLGPPVILSVPGIF